MECLGRLYISCHDFCHTFRSNMECLGRYTFCVITSVILSGGMEMSVEHGMLREVAFLVMTSVILSDGVKMSVEHGMLRHTKRIRA